MLAGFAKWGLMCWAVRVPHVLWFHTRKQSCRSVAQGLKTRSHRLLRGGGGAGGGVVGMADRNRHGASCLVYMRPFMFIFCSATPPLFTRVDYLLYSISRYSTLFFLV